LISDAALKAKDWETAQLYSKMLLQRNTAAIIRSEAGNQVLSEDQVNDAINRNRCQGLLESGKAFTGKGDYDSAIAAYREASQLATYNYAGYPNYPYGDLDLLWAQTLLQKGDYKAAIEKISIDAIVCERDDAREILKKAYDSAKLGSDLEGFINQTRTRIAKLVPEFQAVGYDGKKVSHRKLKGKVTLVSLWSPSCGPCRVELPRLKPIYEEFHKRGLEIVVIDGENDTKNALKFIKESGLPYQFLESGPKKGKIEQGLFGFPSYPTSYLIDKNGKLVYAIIGYSDGDEEKQRRRIARFLND
jgi:thiol-disulfide isomerase/thioredoxin